MKFLTDTNPSHRHFYVTAIDDDRPFLCAGPWPTHQGALDAVATVRSLAEKQRPQSVFYAWGTSGSQLRLKAPVTPERLAELVG